MKDKKSAGDFDHIGLVTGTPPRTAQSLIPTPSSVIPGSMASASATEDRHEYVSSAPFISALRDKKRDILRDYADIVGNKRRDKQAEKLEECVRVLDQALRQVRAHDVAQEDYMARRHWTKARQSAEEMASVEVKALRIVAQMLEYMDELESTANTVPSRAVAVSPPPAAALAYHPQSLPTYGHNPNPYAQQQQPQFSQVKPFLMLQQQQMMRKTHNMEREIAELRFQQAQRPAIVHQVAAPAPVVEVVAPVAPPQPRGNADVARLERDVDLYKNPKKKKKKKKKNDSSTSSDSSSSSSSDDDKKKKKKKKKKRRRRSRSKSPEDDRRKNENYEDDGCTLL